MTHVICTVGYPAAGKSVVKQVAESYGIPAVSMGDQIRTRGGAAYDALKRSSEEDVTVSRSEFLGQWATDQRGAHGKQIVAEWTVEHIEATTPDASLLLIDGMRSIAEFEVFQQAFEEAEILYIDTPFDRRLAFIQSRGRDGEDTFDADDLAKRDAREESWGGFTETIEEATYRVENTGTKKRLETELTELFSTLSE